MRRAFFDSRQPVSGGAGATLDRRHFCASLGALALGTACRIGREEAPFPDADAPTDMSVAAHGSGNATVVEVRWREAVDGYGKVNAAAVRAMLAAAMGRLVGDGSPFAEWAAPQVKVGIKVNSMTSQAFTHPEVAGAVAESLVRAGASPSGVTVWDRDTASLVRRGYVIDETGASGYCCLGTNLTDPGASKRITVAGHEVVLSPLVEASDVLFNIAALKDHSMAGVTLSLKNNFGMLLSAMDLHGPITQGSGCEPGISDLAARPEIRGRLALAILDGLLAVCEGGPGPADPAHVFRYAGLLASRDPVALDRRGLAIIEARRALLGLPPLAERTAPNPSPPVHIENAARKGVSPV
ncbi:MAG: DUF362 domain-containing protein [Deltaproteobacteria bacterium]|nr:DUF362 domain-containing protein [Deltaproteobacteria bacterium]